MAVARYFSFRLRYEGTELVIRSGIIFRNERHVPYARIQNLDAVRNVAHRLLGVAEVRVETGGGRAPEATISVLHETVFEEMRRRIFEGRARAVQADIERPDAQPASPAAVESRTLLHLPLRELLLNGLLDNRGMVLVGAAYGVLWEAGLFRGVWDRLAGGVYGPGLVRDTALTIAAGNVPPLARIAVLVAGLVGLLLLVRVLSMIWSGVRLHEFTAVARGRGSEDGIRAPDARHGDDSAASRADADDSRNASPAARRAGCRSAWRRPAGPAPRRPGPSSRASGWRPSSGRPPCRRSCAKCFPASWISAGSTGTRCTRGRFGAR